MIPVGDSPRSLTRPWVNYSIILACAAVFLWMLTLSHDQPPTASQRRQAAEDSAVHCYGLRTPATEIDRFYCRRGFQAKEFFDTVRGQPEIPGTRRGEILASLFTSLFVHAGWLHILGNMLFLWVFGDNVEDRLGHFAYALFYLLGGVVAAFAQAFIDPDTVVPAVGASGAVASVLGAYLVFFPRATVKVVIPFFILIFLPIPVPAAVMIGLWFLQNLLAGVATLGAQTAADSGVAFFAHIGGFLFGLLLTWIFLRRVVDRPQSPAY